MRLKREFHLDLSGWLEFFQSWNGYSFLLSPRWAPLPDLHVSSNAAGSVGYGAILGRDWLAGEMVSITDALIHCLQRTLSGCSGSFPVGSSVVRKVGGILF